MLRLGWWGGMHPPIPPPKSATAPRRSEVEIDALVTAVESNRKQILGSFSSEVTLN